MRVALGSPGRICTLLRALMATGPLLLGTMLLGVCVWVVCALFTRAAHHCECAVEMCEFQATSQPEWALRCVARWADSPIPGR